MNVIPPTPADLRYLQEGCYMNFPETPIADLLSAVPVDDPCANPPWNQSFMSLLMDDPPADADLSSSDDSFARTLDLKSQSTQEDSSVKSQSIRSDLWCSEEEESNYLASLGLGVASSEDYSGTTVDSWSMMEDQMLRSAMADIRVMEQSVIHWERIAEALPWRTPVEVFNRTNQMLQSIQRDLSNATSQQNQQQTPTPRKEEKQQQRQIRQVRKRWSKEEDDKFRAGFERYGWGNWKKVATLIPGRTVPQITSHAQQYIRKQKPMPKRINLIRSSL